MKDHEITDEEKTAVSKAEAEQLPLPMNLFEPQKEVRPDYNIGKFAGLIFTSPYAKNVREVRTYNWNVSHGDDTVEASLTVSPLVGLKTPTTTTLRVYLALVQVWENMGKPEDGIVNFSARQLCNVIGWRWGGKDTAGRIYDHLKVLSGTSLDWVLSYTKRDKALDELRTNMSILSSADYRQRKHLFKPDLNQVVQRVRFNPDLIENMLAGHVRPLNHETIRKIGNDTTANLYMRLDLYLHRKPKWECRSLRLLTDELGLTGRRYQQRKHRHSKLKEIVKELNGVPLFTGILRLSIEETSTNPKDWKLVARKEMRQAIASPKKRRLTIVNSDEEALLLADELLTDIKNHPKGGVSKVGYIEFLCKHYPADLLRRALSIAKGDYHNQINKSLGAVFVFEVKRLVLESKNYQWYDDKPLVSKKDEG